MKDVYNYGGLGLRLISYSTPEMYGAVGDGVANDTAAVQSAVNDKNVCFMAGKTYKITAPIVVEEGCCIDMNGAALLCTVKHAFHNFNDGDSYGGYSGNGNIAIRNGTIIGGCVSFIHGEHIKLSNIRFRDTLNDHFMEICACKDYIIEGCSFVGMQNLQNASLEYINIDTNASYPAFPHNKAGQNDPVFYDMTTNVDITIRDCYFAQGIGDYAYGFDAIGVHARNITDTYADDVMIVNNTIDGFVGCGLRINAMRGAYIANNYIRATGDGIRVGDVADCDGVIIIHNYITSDNGENIAVTAGQIVDLTVSGNVTHGDN